MIAFAFPSPIQLKVTDEQNSKFRIEEQGKILAKLQKQGTDIGLKVGNIYKTGTKQEMAEAFSDSLERLRAAVEKANEYHRIKNEEQEQNEVAEEVETEIVEEVDESLNGGDLDEVTTQVMIAEHMELPKRG